MRRSEGMVSHRGSWDEFMDRAVRQVEWMDSRGVNYRVPDLTGFERVNAFKDTTSVWVSCPFPSITVRFTTDGKFPTAASPILRELLHIDQTAIVIASNEQSAGRRHSIHGWRIILAAVLGLVHLARCPIGAETAKYERRGLVYMQRLAQNRRSYDYRGRRCGEISSTPLLSTYRLDSLNLSHQIKGWFAIVGEGFFEVDSNSIYTFALNSNDGSMLYVDDKLLIDNDSPHADREIRAQKALAKGWHRLRVEFFDMDNGGVLQLRMNGRVLKNYRH